MSFIKDKNDKEHWLTIGSHLSAFVQSSGYIDVAIVAEERMEGTPISPHQGLAPALCQSYLTASQVWTNKTSDFTKQ